MYCQTLHVLARQIGTCLECHAGVLAARGIDPYCSQLGEMDAVDSHEADVDAAALVAGDEMRSVTGPLIRDGTQDPGIDPMRISGIVRAIGSRERAVRRHADQEGTGQRFHAVILVTLRVRRERKTIDLSAPFVADPAECAGTIGASNSVPLIHLPSGP